MINMWKAIKDSKWYFWIPIVWIFIIPRMADWIFSGKDFNERGYRGILVQLLMFPSLLVIIYIIDYFIKN